MLIPATLQPRVKVMQIIATALMLGLIFFLGVVAFITQTQPANRPADQPIVTYVALAMLVAVLPVSFLMPASMTRAGVLRIATEKPDQPGEGRSPDHALIEALLPLKQTTMILSMAPLEGAGFFNSIAYLIERDPLALGGAVAVLILMALRFPTFGNLAAWLDQQKAAVTAIRMRGGK